MLLNVKDQEDEEDAYEAPTARGECPYGDYPEPRNLIWEFVCTGTLDGWEPERDNRTGRCRLHPEGPLFISSRLYCPILTQYPMRQ